VALGRGDGSIPSQLNALLPSYSLLTYKVYLMEAILEGVEGWVSTPSSLYKVILRLILLSVRDVDILAILDYRLPFLTS
jgi:hypothetical protein